MSTLQAQRGTVLLATMVLPIIPQEETTMYLYSRLAMLFGAVILIGTAQAAGPSCSPDVKEAIVKEFTQSGWEKMPEDQRLRFEAAIYDKYQSCSQVDDILAPDPAYCGKTSYQGSTWYEQMTCCGYDPQRRMFSCPVSVKQTYGFGGAPLPGSREYVLNCVRSGAIFVPVGVDSVHLSNEFLGANPPWQFNVIAAANTNIGLLQPMSGQTRVARSILSWQLQPTNCNYRPIWGNVLDYQIRLNQ
ncbi:hypothetical protein FNU76_20120 [Chitinimonas arctica]|uniref:Uncharacterized protein n=1 Tax=Chitinimonas arctica TaxID=2594795 RepID=A0A516SJZ6_9NEIS|nr:hypothetical protein [Chitinimonas arctica]QDQ28477.1 hypothetical protein FNU76_20120 [Chitinimonas arctica]